MKRATIIIVGGILLFVGAVVVVVSTMAMGTPDITNEAILIGLVLMAGGLCLVVAQLRKRRPGSRSGHA